MSFSKTKNIIVNQKTYEKLQSPTVAHKYKTQHKHTKHNTNIQNTTQTYKTQQYTVENHNTNLQNTTQTDENTTEI